MWPALLASTTAGLLTAVATPPLNAGPLAWVALVPVLTALMMVPAPSAWVVALPFGVVWSAVAHCWYPEVLWPPAIGYVLIVGVGAFWASVLTQGVLLQGRLPGSLRLLAVPVTWTAVEFLQSTLPMFRDWWFVSLAASQWRCPAALQVLSVAGPAGLTFALTSANVAAATLLTRALGAAAGRRAPTPAALGTLAAVVSIVAWGTWVVSAPPPGRFTIAATADLAWQDETIRASRHPGVARIGHLNTPTTAAALFEVNAALTRLVATKRPAFVVWPENEIGNADDPLLLARLGSLAREVRTYLVTNPVLRGDGRLYDAALVVGPYGEVVGLRRKIHLSSPEMRAGVSEGPEEFGVFATPYGFVGVGVCYDFHFRDVVQQLARNGARIVLMPTDDDFGTPWFPPVHAADAVFRAVEHRVAFATGTTNGVSLVVDPYGRIQGESGVDIREVITGEVFVAPEFTLYTRFGDWFGWTAVAGLLALVGIARPHGSPRT